MVKIGIQYFGGRGSGGGKGASGGGASSGGAASRESIESIDRQLALAREERDYYFDRMTRADQRGDREGSDRWGEEYDKAKAEINRLRNLRKSLG